MNEQTNMIIGWMDEALESEVDLSKHGEATCEPPRSRGGSDCHTTSETRANLSGTPPPESAAWA